AQAFAHGLAKDTDFVFASETGTSSAAEGTRGWGTTHPRGPDSYFLPQFDSAADSTIASACSELIAPEATNVCTDRATVETYCPWFFQATPAVGPLQDGSATPASENVVLNVPVPTMSVPTLSQSGSRFAFLIHSCRSGMNIVPGGATIGRGAESQRK